MLKKWTLLLPIVMAAIILTPISARAYITETDDSAAMIEDLYEGSGADKLIYAVPENARSDLGSIGFEGFFPGGTDSVTAQGVLGSLVKAVRSSAAEPLRVLMCIVGIVLISAAFEAVKSGGAADAALSVVSLLCAVSVLAPPVLELTAELSDTIASSSSFMLAYVPVMAGLMAASGQPSGGAMYSGMMIFLSSAVMQITSHIVVPLLKCVMALSVASSASSTVSFDGVVNLFRKAARFLLTFCMSFFAAFLTMKSIVAAAADSLANRAVKFAIGSFVPLVGGALSDAYQTVVSCLGVLKSGVGAAAIAAVFVMFVPFAVRCAVWQAVTALGAAVCDIFDLQRISSLLTSMSSVTAVIFAVLMCSMVMYIISTAIIMIVGG